MSRKHKNKKDGALVALHEQGSGKMMDRCSFCKFDPLTAKPPLSAQEWCDWDEWKCPNCKVQTFGKGKPHGLVSTGVKQEYNSYDEYWEGQYGGWPDGHLSNQPVKQPIGYVYSPGTAATAYKACDHSGDRLELAKDVAIYGFSHVYSAKDLGAKTKDGKEVDLFVALHDGWMKRTDVMMSPGLVDFVTKPVKPAMIWINTPDYDIPYSLVNFLDAARYAIKAARAGKVVAAGCMGGHGRTGMFLSTCAMMVGDVESAEQAVELVQDEYCEKVKESEIQQAMLSSLWELVICGSEDKIPEVLKATEKARKKKAEAWKSQVGKYVYAPIADQGPPPKQVRISEAVKSVQSIPEFVKNSVGKLAAVKGWNGTMAGAILVVIEGDAVAHVLYKTEYEVTIPGDPVIPAAPDVGLKTDATNPNSIVIDMTTGQVVVGNDV